VRDSKPLLPNAGLLLDFLQVRPRLNRLIARIVEPHEIDDILQETYIRACAAFEKTPVLNPRSFLLKTAQNLAFNHLNTAYHRRVRLADASAPELERHSPDLESQFEAKEAFLAFRSALRALPPQCRRAFILRKVQGLSQREIAEFLGISESTVEKHVAKGLLLVRESLLRKGHMETRRIGHAGQNPIRMPRR
jgi:RNA polymerase sigma factor (sigma-70 family)